MKHNKDIYIEVRALIEDKHFWCKGHYSDFKTIGRVTYEQHCLLGAMLISVGAGVEDAIDRNAFPELLNALEKLYPNFYKGASGLLELNDREGHAAVLAVLDEAIAQS